MQDSGACMVPPTNADLPAHAPSSSINHHISHSHQYAMMAVTLQPSCRLLIAIVVLLLLPSITTAFSAPPIKPSSSSHHHPKEAFIDESTDEQKIKQILIGKHKWLGGALDKVSGTIYGIPSHSSYVISLSPPTTTSQNNDNDSDYQINMLKLPSYIINNQHNDGGKYKYHQFKWLRGIIHNNNTLFGIPSWSKDGILMVDIREWSKYIDDNPLCSRIIDNDELSNRFITTIPFPEMSTVAPGNDNDEKQQQQQKHYRWAYHGAAMNTNSTAIYCIPSNARHVLKLDLETLTTSYLDIPPPPLHHQQHQQEQEEHEKLLQYSNKWYGGILGDDNCIYGIPYAAGSILCINANTEQVSLLGNFGWNKYNFHGGVKSKLGSIYAFPAHADTVLKIDTTVRGQDHDDDNDKISLLPIHRAPYDQDTVTRYKWLGGCIGADDNIYGMASDASSVLHINIQNDVVTTFGCIEDSDPNRRRSTNVDNVSETTTTTRYIEKNKFQGGVLARDGYIYALPSNAKGICRIDSRPLTDDEKEQGSNADDDASPIFLDKNRVTCIGSLEQKTDKWQGGFAVDSGAIIAIPENCNSVLKVLPPCAEDADRYIEEGIKDGGVIISSL